MTNKSYLIGDVRYTDKARVAFELEHSKTPMHFLMDLQKLMEEYGVVRIDISTDAFAYHQLVNNQNIN